MPRNFDEMMRRLNAYSEGIHPDTGEKLNPDNNKTHKINNLNFQENNKNHKTYNRDYRGLYLLIHSDKDFLLAQDWSMEPALLYKLCTTYGVQWVRSCIRKVNGIGDRYFREGEPVPQQRGRFCRAIIIKEGKPIE